MTLVSMFFIVLVAAFAVVAFFTEPSKTDKLIHTRLVSLDRKVVSTGDEEEGIVKQITFSTIPAFDRFLRTNHIAISLQLLRERTLLLNILPLALTEGLVDFGGAAWADGF